MTYRTCDDCQQRLRNEIFSGVQKAFVGINPNRTAGYRGQPRARFQPTRTRTTNYDNYIIRVQQYYKYTLSLPLSETPGGKRNKQLRYVFALVLFIHSFGLDGFEYYKKIT